jgi:polar amino acid transport system permease protein
MIDWPLVQHSLPALFKGACVSLQITSVTICIGFIMGSVLAFMQASKAKNLVTAYVTLFRGTPMLVQILFVFYVLPQFGLMISPFWAASLAIGLNSAAYVSQIVRSGINAVSKGQFEAAYVLGFSRFQTMRFIVYPQALKAALPSLANELITLVKDSSLASIIGVMELSKEGSLIRSSTYDAFSILLSVAFIYLCLTTVLSFLMKILEKRWAAHV